MALQIRKAMEKDLPCLAALACRLWPEHDPAQMQTELAETMKKTNAVFFLAVIGEVPVGFAQCQLRSDYVEGTDSSPVGYLEGVYVADAYRQKGIAKEMLTACEGWARANGCAEFASDCELHNVQSLRFHLNMGFAEANRIICFTKKL